MLKAMLKEHLVEKKLQNVVVPHKPESTPKAAVVKNNDGTNTVKHMRPYKYKETCNRKMPFYRWTIYSELNQKTPEGYRNAYRRSLFEDHDLKESFNLEEISKIPKLMKGIEIIKLETGMSYTEIIDYYKEIMPPEKMKLIAKEIAKNQLKI